MLLDDPHGPAIVPAATVPFAQLSEQFVRWLERSTAQSGSDMKPTIVKADAFGAAIPEGQADAQQFPDETTIHRCPASHFFVSNICRFATDGLPWLTGLRILWVDDRPANNEVERRLLRELGAQCDDITSTGKAIEAQKSASTTSFFPTWVGLKDAKPASTCWQGSVSSGSNAPFIIYAASWASRNQQRATEAGAFGCTNNRRDFVALVVDAAASARGRRFAERYHRVISPSERFRAVRDDCSQNCPRVLARHVADLAQIPSADPARRLPQPSPPLLGVRDVQVFRIEDSKISVAAERGSAGMSSYRAAVPSGLVERAVRTRKTVWTPDVLPGAGLYSGGRLHRVGTRHSGVRRGRARQLRDQIERESTNAYSARQLRWLEDFVRAYPLTVEEPWTTESPVPPLDTVAPGPSLEQFEPGFTSAMPSRIWTSRWIGSLQT